MKTATHSLISDTQLQGAVAELDVKDGVVVLIGNVGSYADKITAGRMVRRLAGVTALADDPKVRSPGLLRPG